MGWDLTGLGSVADLASTVINKIWPPDADPTQKMAAQLELQKMIEQRENLVIEARERVLVAELTQGDAMTKRARPSVVYAGLIFIFLIHVAFPMITYWTKATVPTLSLPTEFWWAWTGIVATWTIGRSFEKSGVGGKAVDLITGKKS